MQTHRRLFPILMLALTLATGCSFRHSIARQAVDFNRAVSTSETQTLLLNVLRARDRLPPYYTTISQVRGSLSGSLQSQLQLPFGGDADSTFTETITGSVSSSPTFDLNVLDSEEFHRGITTPVKLSLLRFYWNQGWPKEVLLYLMISSIRIDIPSGPVILELHNDGSGVDREFVEFAARIVEDVEWSRRPYWTSKTTPFGPPTPMPRLEELAKAKEQKLGVSESGKVTSGSEVSLVCPRCKEYLDEQLRKRLPDAFASCEDADRRAREKADQKKKAKSSRKKEEQNGLWSLDAEQFVFSALEPELEAKEEQEPIRRCRRHLITRSPESMIYYLGEAIRDHDAIRVCIETQTPGDGQPDCTSDRDLVPGWLFSMDARYGRVRSRPSVRYGSQWYAVGEGKRPLTALALVRQLVSLQKKGKDLPTTNAVTVVGR